MAQSEIEAIRALLSSKPRPVGWPERRKRLDDVGSVWPVADDVELSRRRCQWQYQANGPSFRAAILLAF